MVSAQEKTKRNGLTLVIGVANDEANGDASSVERAYAKTPRPTRA